MTYYQNKQYPTLKICVLFQKSHPLWVIRRIYLFLFCTTRFQERNWKIMGIASVSQVACILFFICGLFFIRWVFIPTIHCRCDFYCSCSCRVSTLWNTCTWLWDGKDTVNRMQLIQIYSYCSLNVIIRWKFQHLYF